MPLDENEVTRYTVDGVEYDFTPQELAELDREGEIMQLEAETDKAEAELIDAMEAEIEADAELLEAENEAEALNDEAEAVNREAEKVSMESDIIIDEYHYVQVDEINDIDCDFGILLDELNGDEYNDVLRAYTDETNEAESLLQDAEVGFERVDDEYYEANNEYYEAEKEYDAA